MELNKIHQGDWKELATQLDDNSIDMIMTSPPYWGLRDYGTATWIESNDLNCDHKVGRDTRKSNEWMEKKLVQGTFGDEAIKTGHRCPKCNALRVDRQLGLEPHPKEFIQHLVDGFAILRNKLKKTGSLYLNLGDTYYGSNSDKNSIKNPESISAGGNQMISMPEKSIRNNKDLYSNWLQPKQLMLMPSRVAIAMQEDGWILRNDIIWHKPNPMPSSVKDRLNTTYEHLFHFVKSRKYFYDLDAIREKRLYDYDKKIVYDGKNPICTSEKMFKADHKNYNNRGIIEARKLGIPDSQLNNPLGKNPGDIIKEREQEVQPGFKGRARDSLLITNRPPDYFGHHLGKNPGDFFNITTQPYKEAHFATYPEKLCEKPIKSSCPSEICIKCGFIKERIREPTEEYKSNLSQNYNPRVQVNTINVGVYLKKARLEKKLSTLDVAQHFLSKTGRLTGCVWNWENGISLPTITEWKKLKEVLAFDDKFDFILDLNIIKGGRDWNEVWGTTADKVQYKKTKALTSNYQTVGFTSCNCNAEFKAGIVLDPFAGAGTTLLVARKLSKQLIGFELKQEYIDIANKRIKPFLEQKKLSEVI